VGDYIFDERLVLVGEDGAKWDAGDRTAFVVEGKYWVNNHAHVLRCKQGVLVDGWLANFLTMSDLNTYVSGLTVPKLNQGSLVSIEIPVPPLKEQKRIVALLDAATARVTELTACYEQARTHANNLFTSALRDVLEGNPDWPVKTLGQVCSIESVLVDPRDPKYSRMSHIGAGNIEAGTGRVFDIKTASEENLISGKYLFTKNDVLYSKIRPYLVKVATPETAGLCSADVYPLQPGPLLTRMFLFYSLISETFTEYAISGSSRTGMPKVNREHLFKHQLRIPPTATQSEIVSRLEALRAKTSEMVAAYDAKLAAAKNLRQSILEAAFGGDL
jgi:type I restriction enzyme S subunit